MNVLQMSLRTGVPLLAQDVEFESPWKELQFQADVDRDRLIGKLVVDQPGNKHHMILWAEILNLRQRLDGMEGVRAVWNGMLKRGVDLPTEGDLADVFWETFIRATTFTPRETGSTDSGADCALTCGQIFEYATNLKERTGRQYPKLYKLLIGHCLRIRQKDALRWHRAFIDNGMAASDAFIDVAEDLMTMASARNGYRYFFKPVYAQHGRTDQYDAVISRALQYEVNDMTMVYHRFFVLEGDLPSATFAQDSRVKDLFRQEDQRARRIGTNTKTKDDAALQAAALQSKPYATVNREMMNTIVGEVHDIKPKEFSDEFCARMFATRAFSIGWVIKGLAMFGADKLGPLAMREMAVRAGSPEVFCKALAELRTAVICTDGALFSRLLEKVAIEGHLELWQVLLESDQHPAAYDDARTQSDLLKLFLEQQKWTHVHLNLLAASLSGTEGSFMAWNRLLQYYLSVRDYPSTALALQSIQNQRLPLTARSLGDLRTFMLPRERGRRPAKGRRPGYFDPREFVAAAYIYSMRVNLSPIPAHWVEVLKCLGMNHQWAQFERVVLALLKGPELPESDDDVSVEKEVHLARLRAIFRPNMRRALFIWGFRSASVRDQLRPFEPSKKYKSSEFGVFVEPWARGLALQKRLRDVGLEVGDGNARAAFVQRMWVLFGPGYSTRPINHEARRINRLSLAHYIRHANTIWEGLVDWVEPELLEKNDDPRLLPAFFGDVYKTSRKRREFADVKAWAGVFGSGAEHTIEPRLTGAKEAAWMRSPLRISFTPMQPIDRPQQSQPQKPPSAQPSSTPPIPPHPPPTHQSPAAHSPNSHPPPNPPSTQAKP